jgi:hypothetical protein
MTIRVAAVSPPNRTPVTLAAIEDEAQIATSESARAPRRETLLGRNILKTMSFGNSIRNARIAWALAAPW